MNGRSHIATASPSIVSGASYRQYGLRKLHSLSGVVPVGIFLVEHIWTNARALGGRKSFDEAVDEIQRLPALPWIELFGIALPLAFHALYGIGLSLRARPNVVRYPYASNWRYTLQRLTGAATLAFLVYHLWQFRVQKMLGAMAPVAFYPTLSAELSSTALGLPIVAMVYLAGLAAAVLHFSNGLWGFSVSWGIAVSRRAQRFVAGACGLAGLALFVLGAQTVLYFATGARLLAPPFAGDLPEPCTLVPSREPEAPLSRTMSPPPRAP